MSTQQTTDITSEETLPLGALAQPARRKSRHRVRSRHEAGGRRSGVPVKPISLSVPASVSARWRAYSQARRRSLVDVMLDAVNANAERLPTLVREHQTALRTAAQPVTDGLFVRQAAAVRDETDPYVTMPLRMLSTNVDTLDRLTYETAADSRSQFVVAVMIAYLADLDADAQR